MREYVISKTESGIKLSRLLFKLMPDAPSGMIYKSLRRKRVRLNGKRVTSGSIELNAGDRLELYFNDELFTSDRTRTYKAGRLNVIYEDDNIAVLFKSSGLPSQEPPGGGDSLENRFRAYAGGTGAAYLPSLCHRIDRNTSGLVIAAKNLAANRFITEKIRTKEIKKLYICRVEGMLSPESGTLRGYIRKDGRDRVLFSENGSCGAKPAVMTYRVLNYSDGYTDAEIELLTGRTHQIRAGMAYIGHPIAGDVKYGAARLSGGGYQQLCAYKLRFEFEGGELGYLSGREFEHAEY